MILEVIALNNDMNKMNKLWRCSQRLGFDRQKFCPLNAIGACNQRMFYIYERGCSKFINGIESDDILNESNISF